MRKRVVRALIDDDQDCVVLRVTLEAPASGGDEASCHVGYRSCFYREIGTAGDGTILLHFTESTKAFDPVAVYGETPNPTRL
jgi:phosphoribosyl-AMP cyclohydrolase